MALSWLVVDDHAAFLAAARSLLESDGFHDIGLASDGQSAIAAAVRDAPGALLIDVQLPDMSGFEVAREIVRRGLDPLIILTSSRQRSDYGTKVDSSVAPHFVEKAGLRLGVLKQLVVESGRP